MGNSQKESKSQSAGHEVPGTETVTGYVFVCCHLLGDLGTAELPAVEEMLIHSPGIYEHLEVGP